MATLLCNEKSKKHPQPNHGCKKHMCSLVSTRILTKKHPKKQFGYDLKRKTHIFFLCQSSLFSLSKYGFSEDYSDEPILGSLTEIQEIEAAEDFFGEVTSELYDMFKRRRKPLSQDVFF